MPETKIIRWDTAKGERGNGPGVCDANMNGYCGYSVGDRTRDGYRVDIIIQEGTKYEAHLVRD